MNAQYDLFTKTGTEWIKAPDLNTTESMMEVPYRL